MKKFIKKISTVKLAVFIAIFVVMGSLGFAYGLSSKNAPLQPQPTVKNTKVKSKTSKNKKNVKPKTKSVKKIPKVAKPAVASVSRSEPKSQPIVKSAPNSKVSSLRPTKTTKKSSNSRSSSADSGDSNQLAVGYSSTNWSGYFATGKNFTAVRGSWAVPSVTGNGKTVSADGTWIGIGGVTSGDLIQVGTENTVSPSGKVASSIFYELLPAPAILVPDVPIKAGDNISANILQLSANQWSISITNITTNKNYTKNVIYNSSNSTAEWIQEDPSYSNGSLVPLNNFGTINFWAASATANGVNGNLFDLNALPVKLVSVSGQNIALPSTIGLDGASFSVSHL